MSASKSLGETKPCRALSSAGGGGGGEGGQKKQQEWDTCRAYHRRPTRARMSVVSSRVAPMRDKITSHGPLVTSSG